MVISTADVAFLSNRSGRETYKSDLTAAILSLINLQQAIQQHGAVIGRLHRRAANK